MILICLITILGCLVLIRPSWKIQLLRKDTNQVSDKRLFLPRKVFHFLKEAGYGIGNMQAPQFFDDVDEQRGLLIIDVGACHGSDWAVPSAKKRGHTVLAFEPMPANRERFMDTVRNNDMQDKTEIVNLSSLGTAPIWPIHSDGKVFLFAACVSDKVEIVQLYAEGELASIYPQNFYPASSLNTGKQPINVQALTLDSIVANQDVHILKIDTQGHELSVLRGARRLFEEARINIVELEFWPKGMEAGGVNPVEVLDYLHGFGFMCFDYSRNRHIPSDRASDFEGFVASFDGSRDSGFGAWDELVCFKVMDNLGQLDIEAIKTPGRQTGGLSIFF